jgi:hypothetical protein
MGNRYCYWSVADGPYARLMEECVASARRAGVFKEFHVLTDRPIEGCECYDAQELDKSNGLFKLIYLKAGISKLLFDYYVWIDADSWFVRNPVSVLGSLCHSPIHVPLSTNLSELAEDARLNGISTKQYIELMSKEGVYNPVYRPDSAFWIIHRDAIDRVYELAGHFRAKAEEKGLKPDGTASLGYAMQMLCANPEAHRVKARPDLWASDDLDCFQGRLPDRSSPWPLVDPLTRENLTVNPAVIHLPWRRAEFDSTGTIQQDEASTVAGQADSSRRSLGAEAEVCSA